MSYHLRQLRQAGVLRDRRGHADARDIYYSLNLPHLQTLYAEAGRALHPGLVDEGTSMIGTQTAGHGERPLRVLFLCTHNSARSQLAEAILRRLGGSAVEAASAGTEPTTLHPLAAALLLEHGIDPGRHTAKALDCFLGQSFDYVITVCDRTRDRCPVFPGDPLHIHWSFPDPTAIDAEAARRQAFTTIWLELHLRNRLLLNLPHPETGRRLRTVEPRTGAE